VPLARTVKSAVSMPVVAVGLITGIDQAKAIVGTGDADMIALASTILYDPRWPWHAAAELGAQVRAPKQADLFEDWKAAGTSNRLSRSPARSSRADATQSTSSAAAFLQPDAFQRVHAIRRIVDWLGIRSPISQSRRASSREFAKDYV